MSDKQHLLFEVFRFSRSEHAVFIRNQNIQILEQGIVIASLRAELLFLQEIA